MLGTMDTSGDIEDTCWGVPMTLLPDKFNSVLLHV